MQQAFFNDYGKAIIRVPFYSYQQLFGSGQKTKDLEEVVLRMIQDEIFLEGLYWSSPQLYQTVLTFKKGRLNPERKKKLLHTLKKYAIRASTRCTPYGIYAGCVLVDINAGGSLESTDRKRKVRIDMGMLQQVVKRIEADEALWLHLQYQVNNSLYQVANQYRLVESVIEEGKCQYQVSSIEHTSLLEQLIEFVQRNGLVTIDDMDSLTREDITYNELVDFAKKLIETQLLVSELQLGLTAANELDNIQAVLKRLVERGVTEAIQYLDVFEKVTEVLQLFDLLPLGILPLKQISELEVLLGQMGIAAAQQHLFHADLKQAVPAGFSFPQLKPADWESVIFLMGKLSPHTSPHETQLERFKKKFAEKYETRAISLPEALDPEFGIGFPSIDSIGNALHHPLAEKINLGSKRPIGKRAHESNAWLQDKLESLDQEALRKGICLCTEDLDQLDGKPVQLPNQFTVMGTLLSSGKILLHHIGGSHANVLLGRFAYLEKEIGSFCRELSTCELQANEQVIYAEIIHIPEGRVGNIARRIALYEYEIPFLASGAVAAEKQLPVSDIMVSVQQDEIVLWSRKCNKRIIPRLSNAHNYLNSSIPVYKFLASVQHQGKPSLEINWGSLAQYKRFLPRISYKNFVLYRASWFLQESDIRKIRKAVHRMDALKQFLVKWKVERFVCFCEGDNELFIDTHNEGYLQLLLEEIKGVDFIRLAEWMQESIVAEEEVIQQPFIQQFILPMGKQQPSQVRLFASKDADGGQRAFAPGSEWVYFKIYCGASVSDDILSKALQPLVTSLLKKAIVDQFFFVRYTDPNYHIRFRLHLAGEACFEPSAVITAVHEALHNFLDKRVVWKIELGTYQREIERYGNDCIIATERAFFYDSLLCLTCMEDAEFLEEEQVRLLAAVENMDKWLSLFNLSLEERIAFCAEMSNAFLQEFGREAKRRIDLQYQEWKKVIVQFLKESKFTLAFASREKKLRKLALPIDNISSYIHMSLNRWFATEQRLMEFMVYHFCWRYYNQLLHQTNGA